MSMLRDALFGQIYYLDLVYAIAADLGDVVLRWNAMSERRNLLT